ncbi:Iron-sulfur assembly protein 1 [Rhodotorula toruloides]|nr:Iron-sulfur assembly protein 1 [Rhodotorula toruloides]
MSLRTSSQLLRTSLRTLAPRATPPCPACAFAASQLRHPSSSSLRTLSYTAPARAPILDQTPTPAVHPAPIPPKARPRQAMRARKAALTLVSRRFADQSLLGWAIWSPKAVDRIRGLLDQPSPKLIRVGVRNKGCAGMSYHLEYVDKPDKFDEVVEQDGVKVVIDSKALFSIIGSEMDWQEDALQARFVFNNPNIKDACGCGESFIV